MAMAKQALAVAGPSTSILDLPCGTGRFWPVLGLSSATQLVAADASKDMLNVARQHGEEVDITLINTSAFSISLGNNSIDTIFCMRLIHHLGLASDRLTVLREFHRVCRKSVCVSLWVNGNVQSYRRRRLERRREANAAKRPYQNRFVIPAHQFEAECREAGFTISAKLDMLPLISMWRVYVLAKVS
jgi:ubiquinone/menaquinone biosynthesis C-methylase UbiE